MMSFQEQVKKYLEDGFKPVEVNKSGLGTEVLVKENVVVRIGTDTAYEHFARLVTSKTIQSENVPIIYNHEPQNAVAETPFLPYSITSMELLEELSDTEAEEYEQWIKDEILNIGKGHKVENDPFGILNITKTLVDYASMNELNLDLVQPKNVMKRGNIYIHIDPFA